MRRGYPDARRQKYHLGIEKCRETRWISRTIISSPVSIHNDQNEVSRYWIIYWRVHSDTARTRGEPCRCCRCRDRPVACEYSQRWESERIWRDRYSGFWKSGTGENRMIEKKYHTTSEREDYQQCSYFKLQKFSLRHYHYWCLIHLPSRDYSRSGPICRRTYSYLSPLQATIRGWQKQSPQNLSAKKWKTHHGCTIWFWGFLGSQRMEDSLSRKGYRDRRSWESGMDDVGTNPDNIISLLSVSLVFPRTFYILEFSLISSSILFYVTMTYCSSSERSRSKNQIQSECHSCKNDCPCGRARCRSQGE